MVQHSINSNVNSVMFEFTNFSESQAPALWSLVNNQRIPVIDLLGTLTLSFITESFAFEIVDSLCSKMFS